MPNMAVILVMQGKYFEAEELMLKSHHPAHRVHRSVASILLRLEIVSGMAVQRDRSICRGRGYRTSNAQLSEDPLQGRHSSRRLTHKISTRLHIDVRRPTSKNPRTEARVKDLRDFENARRNLETKTSEETKGPIVIRRT